MEMKNEREEMVEQIEHFSHEHPLVFVEEQSNEGEKAYCSGCGEVLSGPCFSCVQCNYHLHKKCAEAPYSIYKHPLHPTHSRLLLLQRPYKGVEVYGCALCKEKRNMFFYECRTCWFSLDIKCANFSSSYKFNQDSKHDAHQHPLTFIENPMDELKRLYCPSCREPLVDEIYICFDCPLVLHKKCLDETIKVKHPSHRLHPLFLEYDMKTLFCNPCQKKHDGLFFRCSLCDFNIDIKCAGPRPIVEDKSRHQHPFTLLWRQDSFICDACGIEGNCLSYICSTCNFMVHKDCTQLPRIIKITRHNHCIFHKYFLETEELRRHDCKICFKEVKLERGSYSCVKPSCNFVVHVNCAIEDEDLYDVIEQENQCEELYENLAKSMHSSINRVIEENEDGEATKIEHFSHEHCLVLADKIKEEFDRKCDGCMLSISTLFYYCSECHYFLHKTCAELPRIENHWFRRFNATLEPRGFSTCEFCYRFCSGFFYKIEEFNVCLRCAIVPHITECQGHEHFLFYDYNFREQCNACGVRRPYGGAFICGKCTFTLDFACLTLPLSAPHKFDEHMLNLTYHDDKEQCYCDICEEERDPSLWYYYCSICDNSAHPECVLGEYPFLKDGITWRYGPAGHHHDVCFLRKVKGYPKCSRCDKLCLEEILKCEESTCNYIIHCKCLSVDEKPYWWL